MHSITVSTIVAVIVCVQSLPTQRQRAVQSVQQLEGSPVVMETDTILHDPLENRGVEVSNGILVEGDILWRPDQQLQTGSAMPIEVAPVAGHFFRSTPEPLSAGPAGLLARNPEIRNSVSMTEQTWTDRIVPYVLDTGFDQTELAQIHTALTEVMDGSGNCITFVPRQHQTDFLFITGRLKGCYSLIGRIGGNQTVSISQESGCVEKGIVMHELMHALGFWHEHTRFDRDQYIHINNDNILTSNLEDFHINRFANRSLIPYDYYSIMHYTTTQFSNNPPSPTIEILNSSVIVEEVGQRKYLTDKDRARIRELYNCPLSKCSYPLTLNDEHVSVQNTRVGSVVQYSCSSPDDVLIGATERTCLYTGMWSGSTPLCFHRHAAPIYCDFEDAGACGWNQDTNDEADWTRYSSHTPSDNTGPIIDHSTQTTDGFYMYMEGSNLNPNDSARFISPEFPPEMNVCMLFWYNMYGEGMGTLTVLLRSTDGTSRRLWSLSGNQNMGWKKVLVIDINSTVPYNLVFEGLRGPLDTTDMAIDDVIIGSCQDITSYENAIIREEKADNHSCDFNKGTCGWNLTLNGTFGWSTIKGHTPSLNTGPDCDLDDCANGSYLYIESSQRNYGDTALAMSPVIQAYGSICITFLYHMFGDDIGNLTAYLVFTSNVTMQVWHEHGNHGNTWMTAKVQQFVSSDFQLMLSASAGQGFRGDIAFDDVNIFSGECPTRISCDFDSFGLCDFMNEPKNDDFDWSLATGSTMPLATGPTSDHTSGSGNFLYIEASAPRIPGERARLLTPFLSKDIHGYCVNFWYYMYGQDVSTFSIYLRFDDGIESGLWTRKGNQGQHWIEAKFHVDTTTVNNTIQIVFEAVVGQSYASDIAVDDIIVKNGAC